VDLVSGYPAILIGLGVGMVATWRRWPMPPVLAAGALIFALLVFHQSTGPALVSPEGNGTMTAPLWAVLALVNMGCWALGIAMGVAVAGLRRDPHPR
jgi:hypothetical protein